VRKGTAMQQAVDWLEKLGMSEYAQRFAENGIDFATLHHLTDQDLREIGVLLGHRRIMLAAIGELARTAEPEAQPVETVRRFGGFVAKYMGVYFGYPQAHEDDAERAVPAGLDPVEAVPKLKTPASPLQVRVGIAMGLVVVGDLIGSGASQERGIVGETPNLAARLQGIAEPLDARRSYVAGLDGLRAIAVSTVFLGHAFSNFVANSVGVDMFFALSGFLITRGLAAQLESSGRIDLRQFYIRRALRLMPALVLVVGSLLVVAALGDHFRQHMIASLTALTYLMNWSRAFHIGPTDLLEHTWSLSIEEQFYLLWPLTLIAIYRWFGLKGATWCTGLLALLSVLLRVYLLHSGATEDRIYHGFDTRADGLLIGCVLALARPFNLSAWAGRLWLVPVLSVSWVFFFIPWLTLQTLASTIIALACAWLILPLWSGTSPRLAMALEYSPVRYIGRISYGLYLWHWPILWILWELHFASNGLGTAALAGAITLSAAATSFHFVELPILRLKDRLGHRKETSYVVEASSREL
jgi:peptidoglycan/LPS O-acetylase OafA/YrhL